MTAPWDFDQARAKARKASENQEAAEGNIKEAARNYAEAEGAYRLALAKKILELHANGVAWTVTSDIARGDPDVVRLKIERDTLEGVRDAAGHAAWRASNDRQDTQRFIEWSRRVALRVDEPIREEFAPPIGARR
jgi:hypothetical protein